MDETAGPNLCPRCGAAFPVEPRGGVCRACLVAISTDNTSASERETVSPSLAIADSRWPQDAPRLVPGQLFGPYRIERLLGRGGMGDVYEAEHVEQGRRVALKVLNRRLSGGEDRARFLREGQLAASINHPNSVYIFGSEDIDGTPATTMELLRGGTLKDRVKERGPLPPSQAVDAVLQVIAGLDAMQAGGVLHRDVKPSNCFVDADGTVKIGDFGLSISTLARDVTQLTIPGTFMGTPQFAPPEQLKGEPLDVRADIYAVGATAYYLLTGHAPFDDSDVLALVARIATEVPKSPRALAPAVPRGLAAIVLRCLAKDRAGRPANYAALHGALQPFGSAAPTPATLGLRFIAGAIDFLIEAIPVLPISMLLAIRYGLGPPPWLSLLAGAIIVAYYGILEGLWGASIGKRLVGLRVVLRAAGRSPGVARAAWRAVIFKVAPLVMVIPGFALGQARYAELMSRSPLFPLSTNLAIWGLIALLFSTARRRNGFAGVHDLWSGTRVVRRVTEARRPALDIAAPMHAQRTSNRHLGPFEVVGTLGSTDAGTLLVGFDPRLLRRVWLHEVPLERPSVPPLLRDLNRKGRLRWLAGRRTPSESWDAYEALDGMLVTLLDRPQPWRAVRSWLVDLAEEIDAGSNDGSLGPLGLDRVWITRDGRAKLLDFAGPAAPSVSTPMSNLSATSAQRFLSEVATSGLAGRANTSIAAGLQRPYMLPLSASALLDALAHSNIETWSEVVRRTTAIMDGADRVGRSRRAASVALCAAIPLGMALSMGMMVTAGTRLITPEIAELRLTLETAARPSIGGARRTAIETYIARRFGPMITDPHTWTDPTTAAFLGPRRQLAERIIADHPDVSPGEMASASAAVGSLLEGQRRSIQTMRPWAIAGFMGAVQFAFTAILGVLFAWLLRGGLLLRVFGMAVVTRNGERVSRLRALCRGFAAWGLIIVALCLLTGLSFVFVRSPRPPTVMLSHQAGVLLSLIGLAIGMLVIFFVGAVWAVVRPERGLQDRIAGTYLVPQ
jgi:uncharacterized RDD family membrane protein YckC